MTAKIAHHIDVAYGRGLFVDGQEFPWVVAADDLEVIHGPDVLTAVRMTVIADAVTVTDGPLIWNHRATPFRPLDIAAERARLDDLGRRIAATRASRTAQGRP